MLARITDPFSTLSRLSDDFFGLSRYPEEKYTFRPDVDIYEDDKAIYLKAELAGMSVDDIKIDVDKNVLTMEGERKLEKEENKDGYHRVERRYGSFHRSFSLPEHIDAEHIDASYKDGVLTLTLPKTRETSSRKISIKTN